MIPDRTCSSFLFPILTSILMLAPGSPLAAQDKPPIQRPDKARNGGYLGLFVEEVREGDGAALRIREVQKGSDAERLGFRRDDRIVAVDGRTMQNGDDFIRMLWSQANRRNPGAGPRARPGRAGGRRRAAETGRITVRRAGKEVEIRAGLAELDRSPALGEKAPLFELATADGKGTRKLADLIGRKPVFLVFGSYT